MRPSQDAIANNAEGLRLLQARQYEHAIAAFDEAIALQPDLVVAYRNRAEAIRRLGREAAAAADSRNAIAKNAFGLRLLQAGDPQGAVAAFSEAITLRPTWGVAYRNRAGAYRRLGRESEAKADLQQTRRLASATEARPERIDEAPLFECAGFGRRFAAYLVDLVVLSVAGFILGLVFGFVFGESGLVLVYVLTISLEIFYVIGFWVWRGQTPGKMALGIQIVTTDGEPIDVGRAIVRYIGYLISTLILFLGFLMIAWDERKQGLHDKIAGTCVVHTT